MKVGEEIEIVGLRPTLKTVCTGVEMFRKLLDQGQAGDNVGVLLRGTKREEVERGQVLAKPGSITPHTKFTAEVYVLSQGGGWPAHAVLQRLPSAVLFPDDGRDGVDRSAVGDGDGDAWGQHCDAGGADCADRDGRGAAVCDPRGWPDGGCRASSRRSSSSGSAESTNLLSAGVNQHEKLGAALRFRAAKATNDQRFERGARVGEKATQHRACVRWCQGETQCKTRESGSVSRRSTTS